MSATSLDLSRNTDLAWVAELARPVQDAADGARLFIVGAMARELVLVHGFGLHSGRATRDLDFAVRVADWDAYDRIHRNLVTDAGFAPVHGKPHRLRSPDGMVVDLLPFGAIERPDRTIAWPPAEDVVMSTLGFVEVASTTIPTTLPGGVTVDVAGPVGLTLLKLVAWSDRRLTRPGSDAYDLTILLRNYLDAGQEDRLYYEAADLLDDPHFDREVAGAILLGRDIATALGDEVSALQRIIEPESDPDGHLHLVGDLQCDPDHALRLVRGLASGLCEKTSTPHQ